MKLSVDLGSVRAYFETKTALRMIRDAGFDCVDFSYFDLAGQLYEDVLGENYLAYARQLRIFLDSMGLPCNQAHAPFDMTPENCGFEESNPYFLDIVRSMESAAILGAECIIVHPLRPQPDKSILQLNYEMYQSLEPYAEKFGIKIAIENLFGRSVDAFGKKHHRFERPELMLEILRKLNSRHFVCCLDTGHAYITGIQPGEYVRGMAGGPLKALHIHDNHGSGDEHTLPMLGEIDWEDFVAALRETGYDGVFTFETGGFVGKLPSDCIPETLKLIVSLGKNLTEKIERV